MGGGQAAVSLVSRPLVTAVCCVLVNMCCFIHEFVPATRNMANAGGASLVRSVTLVA